MSDREAKDRLYAEFAAVGKVLGHPKRLELLDLLAQGPRSVDELAAAAGLGTSTCSAHLQALREAGVLVSRRDGKRHVHVLAGDDVAGLWDLLRQVAQAHRPHTELARQGYLGPADTETVDTDELLRRLEADEIVVIDVRPSPEYAAGHLPGAMHLPLDELMARIGDVPRGREVVAYCRGRYCVLAHDAVRTLLAHGLTARRAVDGALEWRLAGHLTESSVQR
jgi:rhodanese-related sulfurtransferase/biotin operon repressor